MPCRCPVLASYVIDDPIIIADFKRNLHKYNKKIPYRVTNNGKSIKIYHYVPCGKCYDCIALKRNQWSLRLFGQAATSQSSFFITLTYDDQHVPYVYRTIDNVKHNILILNKPFISKWLKNLVQLCRDRYNVKVSYYLVGEYGWHTGRPHYHLHLFNLPKDVDIYELLRERWTYGNYYIGNTKGNSTMYTTKHNLVKLLNPDDNPNYEAELLSPQFMLCSKNIGLDYLSTIDRKQKQLSILDPSGKPCYLPRYYRDKLLSQDEKDEIKAAQTIEAMSNYFPNEVYNLQVDDINYGLVPLVNSNDKFDLQWQKHCEREAYLSSQRYNYNRILNIFKTNSNNV